MVVFREIYGKQQPCRLIETLEFYGCKVDIIEYLYKGKDPVYHVFEHEFPHKKLLTTLDYSSAVSTIEFQIRKREQPKKKPFNFIKLKLLKLC